MLANGALSALVGYLMGSIPFGLLVGKLRGIDIRQHGSGNIGATNVSRTLGKKWGILVFILDALKGALPVWLVVGYALGCKDCSGGASGVDAGILGIIAAVAAVLGHNFPIWLKFKGGKGVATTAGVLVGLMPWAALAAFLTWVVFFYATRYVSVASLAAAVAIPISVYLLHPSVDAIFYFSIFVCILGIWRHRSNIQRLIAGTESRFEKKKK